MILSALGSGGEARAETRFLTIGTGGVTGIYYPLGGAICRLVNRESAQTGLRCSVASTGGSVYNLNALSAGDLDIGIAQSDWVHHAAQGSGAAFAGQGPDHELRILFSLHEEAFTVLARASAGIRRFDDLKGKRVNIGNPGSGQRATMETVMAALGWEKEAFALTASLKSSEQAQALCDDKIDATVFIVGHPNGALQEASATCATRLVAVEGEAIAKLVAARPYYLPVTVPGGLYDGTPEAVPSFGVKAMLVTSSRLEAATAYRVVAAVFEHLDVLRRLHPAFAGLAPAEMAKTLSSVPLHPGARRYFEARGLVSPAAPRP